jgi:arabinogalactan endo-1,4-beta-galactosidase
MMTRVTLLLTLVLAGCAAAREPNVPLAEKHRGMSYAAASPRRGTYGTPSSAESLRKLKSLGVNWISIMPFAFHRGTPELSWSSTGSWENDDALRAVTKQAHQLGFKVLLKPHVWSRDEAAISKWSDVEWRRFLAEYEKYAVHHATLARELGIDAFSAGNEQKHSTHLDADWRRIIASVRAIYKGPVTYGANFDELEKVPFWDAVDFIGVSAYFPLVDAKTPSRAQLVAAWKPIVARLDAMATRWKKPVMFTELGYRSSDGAAWRQWEIPRDAAVNLEAQRNAYEAFFEAVWREPWLAGVYFWKWFSYPGHSGSSSNDFELENKPAEEVVRRGYAPASATRSSSRR